MWKLEPNQDSENTARSLESLMEDYRKALAYADAATCEALAVSQAIGHRPAATHTVGLSTHVFARLCSHATSMMCSVPKSRWARTDFEHWDIATIAPNVRNLLEGYLLFRYLADAPDDLETQRLYLQVMHLYDCMKRPAILGDFLPAEHVQDFKKEELVIKSRLESMPLFQALDRKARTAILDGRKLMVLSKDDIIASSDVDKSTHDLLWNYMSQYSHMLSFTFYRIELHGRGSGMVNEFDVDALTFALGAGGNILNSATGRLVELFPDTGDVRAGVRSKFSPGPRSNRRARKGALATYIESWRRK